jgi:tetratricopeptide (TPR) repeat protein
MQNSHFQRGQLLFEQRQFEAAVGELRMHLTQAPEDCPTHGLLALALSELERFDEATEHAQRAIHLAPDVPFGHFALAHVMIDRNRYAQAQAAIEEALRLDPYNADYFAILASLHLTQHRWQQALQAADQGLAIAPEHNLCTNFRAQALIKLGNRSAAAATMGEALARRPDDALTHANQGWAKLEEGEPYPAMEHFREALRLNPEMEWARAGIVEALKARNFIYRWMLAYFLWMARLPSGVRMGLVLGALFGQQIIGRMARENPAAAPYLKVLLYAYFGFVLLSWLSPSLFNLLLRLDRFGRYALSSDQVRGANVLAACLLVTLATLVAAIWIGSPFLLLVTLLFALLSLPASAIYVCDSGWPRQTMALITAGLLAAVVFVLVVGMLDVPAPLAAAFQGLIGLLPFAMLGSQFAAMYLAQVTPQK